MPQHAAMLSVQTPWQQSPHPPTPLLLSIWPHSHECVHFFPQVRAVHVPVGTVAEAGTQVLHWPAQYVVAPLLFTLHGLPQKWSFAPHVPVWRSGPTTQRGHGPLAVPVDAFLGPHVHGSNQLHVVPHRGGPHVPLNFTPYGVSCSMWHTVQSLEGSLHAHARAPSSWLQGCPHLDAVTDSASRAATARVERDMIGSRREIQKKTFRTKKKQPQVDNVAERES